MRLIAGIRLAVSIAAIALGCATIAGAQTVGQTVNGFDAKRFFDEIAAKGFTAPTADFDGRKFFQEIEARGFNASNKIDGTTFFAEIAAKGFKAPPGFDPTKFFQEISASGYALPAMIDVKR